MAKAPRKPAVPGASQAATVSNPDVVSKAPQHDARAAAMGLPDFTDKSVDYTATWFAEHPDAPRRNVLTAEGWYVHPEMPEQAKAA
ncbi:MAG: hypothetical protein ACRCV9_17980 [Burkholderiaceae bacterium]